MIKPSDFLAPLQDAVTAQAAESEYRSGVRHADLKNHAAAFQHFKAAADRGHANAMAELTICYEEGLGVPRDPNAAIPYYRRLAELGDTGAKRSILCWINIENGGGASDEKFSEYAELLTGSTKIPAPLKNIFKEYQEIEFRDYSEEEIDAAYADFRCKLQTPAP